jgi:hypothetical protein
MSYGKLAVVVFAKERCLEVAERIDGLHFAAWSAESSASYRP